MSDVGPSGTHLCCPLLLLWFEGALTKQGFNIPTVQPCFGERRLRPQNGEWQCWAELGTRRRSRKDHGSALILFLSLNEWVSSGQGLLICKVGSVVSATSQYWLLTRTIVGPCGDDVNWGADLQRRLTPRRFSINVWKKGTSKIRKLYPKNVCHEDRDKSRQNKEESFMRKSVTLRNGTGIWASDKRDILSVFILGGFYHTILHYVAVWLSHKLDPKTSYRN